MSWSEQYPPVALGRGGRIKRCSCVHRAQNRLIPNRITAGPGADRSSAGSSTRTSPQPEPQVRHHGQLLEPDTQLVALVRTLPDDVGTALMVGHNPDLQELAALLTGHEVEMKTSSIAVLAWAGRWTDTDAETVVLRHHATPRG
jgi:hypothetical protein